MWAAAGSPHLGELEGAVYQPSADELDKVLRLEMDAHAVRRNTQRTACTMQRAAFAAQDATDSVQRSGMAAPYRTT